MAALRQRDTVLAAIELFRRARPDASITSLLAFLYVCENEGLNVTELARLMGATSATASRTATLLEANDDERGDCLVRSGAGERHGNIRTLSLSREGKALRDRVESLIAGAYPITVPAIGRIAVV